MTEYEKHSLQLLMAIARGIALQLSEPNPELRFRTSSKADHSIAVNEFSDLVAELVQATENAIEDSYDTET